MKTLKELCERRTEISKRMSELRNLTNDSQASTEQLEEALTEVESLTQERDEINKEIIQRKASGTEENNPFEAPKTENRKEESTLNLSKREKLALAIGKQVRNKPFTEVEKRALGTALTTTATAYVVATGSADGVNNAGVFVATKPVLDLLKEEGKLSPILSDIVMTHVKGMTTFPYRKSRSSANYKEEGKDGTDGQMEWATLEGKKGYLQTIIVVTDEVQALADIDLGEYIVDQMLQDITEDWANELIYGTGTGTAVTGITKDAIGATYVKDKELEGITDALKKLTGQYRRGAKIYVAQDVYDVIRFARNSKGDYLYPLFNNQSGIYSLGETTIEVDENLKAGEFVIGNVAKYFKVNGLIPLRIETERKARGGCTEYVASQFAATAVVPNAFVYGKLSE